MSTGTTSSARLAARGTVIEVGGPTTDPRPAPPAATSTSGARPPARAGRRHRRRRPFHRADTGPMHIAGAVGVPAVVIYGGYIHPVSTEYPGNINFYSPVEWPRAG